TRWSTRPPPGRCGAPRAPPPQPPEPRHNSTNAELLILTQESSFGRRHDGYSIKTPSLAMRFQLGPIKRPARRPGRSRPIAEITALSRQKETSEGAESRAKISHWLCRASNVLQNQFTGTKPKSRYGRMNRRRHRGGQALYLAGLLQSRCAVTRRVWRVPGS